MDYQSNDPAYGNGSLDLARLSSIDTLVCGDAMEAPQSSATQSDFSVTPSISGAWNGPDHDGEGWLLEVLVDGRALLAWFSYDPSGRQAWFLNTGFIDGNTISFDLSIPSGTDFGPTFDSAKVLRPLWGAATFTFDSCNSGSMTYQSSSQAYGSGNLQLTRLTNIDGLQCDH